MAGDYQKKSGTAATSFPVTRWTVIIAAQGKGADAQVALNELRGLYWQPVNNQTTAP